MNAISIEAPNEVIADLSAALASTDFRLSVPVASKSPADALNAPIGPAEVQQVFQLLTVVFTTGSAGLTFVDKLKKVLAGHADQPVTLRDPETGRIRGTVTADTTEEDLSRIAGQ